MLFSIIIVTFNSQEHIEMCLSQILNTKIFTPFEVIAVDNASNDETCLIIESKFPKVRLVKNKKNLGFAKAANQGAKIAKGEYLLFINPDTVVKNGQIEAMVNFLESKQDVGIVGCKVLNHDNSLQPSCGQFPTILRIIFDRLPILNRGSGIQIRDEKFYSKIREVDWVSASCFVIKKEAFETVEGFNNKIFMYGEDMDLCYRAKQAGFKSYFLPRLKIIHYDTGKNNPLRRPHKYFFMRKGLLLFLKKHRSNISYLIFQGIIRLEALFFLLLLPLRKYKTQEEKDLWRKYLMHSLNIKV